MPKLDTKISDFYGREAPAPYNSRHGTTAMPSPEAMVGMELEIEGWHWATRQAGFRFTEDGSLRNGGIEAITEPVRLMHAPGLLQNFFATFPVAEGNYSERCSTHTHLNVLDFTFENLLVLCLVYQTLERLLFQFVGHDRDKNIFCVPWSQSGVNYRLVYEMSNSPENTCRRWQKYTALNLAPVNTQGTVEFRHLHGTNDLTVITNWLRLIGRMREYAQNTSLEKLTETLKAMNTVSNYGQWMDDVFQSDAHLLRMEGFEKNLSVGVVDTKFMLVNPPKEEKETFKWSSVNMLVDDAVLDTPAPRLRTARAQIDAVIGEQAAAAARTAAQVQQAPRRPARNRLDYWSVTGEPRLVDGERRQEVAHTGDYAVAVGWARNLAMNTNLRATGLGDPRGTGWILEEIV